MLQTSTYGFVQADILIRTGLIAAFDDIRANPWLLDYAFSWLVHDSLTCKEYGPAELRKAKDWFVSNFIPIVNSTQPDFSLPRIAIVPTEDSEAQGEQTLGDVNYSPTEQINPVPEIIAQPAPALGPFTPLNYVPSTGTITLPADLTTANIFPGMMIVDKTTGTAYPIVDVIDDQNFTIASNIVANFTLAIVAPASNLYIARLESISYRQSFRLEPHVPGTSPLSIYLHTILLFALNRYKQQYFEGRGFERMVISSGTQDMYKGQDNPEIIFVQPVTITGYVRNWWPKTISPMVQGIDLGIQVATNLNGPATDAVQGWVSDEDEMF